MKALNWATITPYGIHVDQVPPPRTKRSSRVHKPKKTESAWFSGRVMDILLNEENIIIATSFGGVWRVDTSKPVLEGFDTACLTDSWDDPNVRCLAHGPDNDKQIYAGCEATLRYFELNDESLVTASVLLTLPVSDLNVVYRILIQKNPRKIILATGAGLWWSAIPSVPSQASKYTWTKASGLPGDVISGLCDAGDQAIHAAIFGDDPVVGNNYGIFKGVFQTNNFNFTRSKIIWHDTGEVDRFGVPLVKGDQPVDKHDMVRVSLASCANNRSAAFASVSKSKRGFRGVLKYDAAQDQWEDILDQKDFNAEKRSGEPGSQGEFNNVIGVAPDGSNLVALGWQKGTYVFNPSQVFKEKTLNIITLSKQEDLRIRGDVHSVYFTKSKNGEHELYIGGDGGLLKVSRPARAHHSLDDRLNVFLPTLLFKDDLRAKQYATMDVSPAIDGLIAGGLQDNGCKWLKTAKGKYTAWQQLLRGDGGTNTFLANGILISRESNSGSKFKSHIWNPQSNNFDAGSDIPLDVEVELDPKMEICARIPLPAFRSKDNHLMHGISAAVQSKNAGDTKAGANLLLGLFENAEGSTQFHWKIIGSMMTSLIKAAASADGNKIFVSTDDGKVSLVSPQNGSVFFADLPPGVQPESVKGSVIQFEITKTAVFALFAERRNGVATKGHILVYDGDKWKEISTPVNEVIYSIAADWDVTSTVLAPEDKRLFFSTDSAVYQGVQSKASQESGFHNSFDWQKSTEGLPARPHCYHLRLGWDEKKLFLYLSTYGRSVYRAQLRESVKLPGS